MYCYSYSATVMIWLLIIDYHYDTKHITWDCSTQAPAFTGQVLNSSPPCSPVTFFVWKFSNDDYRHCLTVMVKFFWKLDLRFDLSIWRKIWREERSEMTVRTVGGKICLKRKLVLWKARLVHLSKYLCKEGEAGNQQSQEPSHPDPHRNRTQQSNPN